MLGELRVGSAAPGISRLAELEHEGFVGSKAVWLGLRHEGALAGGVSSAGGRQLCCSSVSEKQKFPLLEKYSHCVFSLFGADSLNRNFVQRVRAPGLLSQLGPNSGFTASSNGHPRAQRALRLF